MPDETSAQETPQNSRPSNRAALEVLRMVQASPERGKPHLMTLLMEAFDREIEPASVHPDRMWEIRQAVEPLWNSPPDKAMAWLLGNPNLPSPEEAEQMLARDLRAAPTPEAAMAVAVEFAASRLQAAHPPSPA